MPDRELIKKYMKQIIEDAERFVETFDTHYDVASKDMPSIAESANRTFESFPSVDDTPSHKRLAREPADLPEHDGAGNDRYEYMEAQRGREDVTRTEPPHHHKDVARAVSEALGHELSVQRRMTITRAGLRPAPTKGSSPEKPDLFA